MSDPKEYSIWEQYNRICNMLATSQNFTEFLERMKEEFEHNHPDVHPPDYDSDAPPKNMVNNMYEVGK